MKEIQKMLDEEIIKPANKKWASYTVFAPRKYDSLIIFVEYRKRSTVTMTD